MKPSQTAEQSHALRSQKKIISKQMGIELQLIFFLLTSVHPLFLSVTIVTLSLSDRPSRGQTHVNLTEGSFSNGNANSWTAEPQNEAICKSLAQRQKERERDRANDLPDNVFKHTQVYIILCSTIPCLVTVAIQPVS